MRVGLVDDQVHFLDVARALLEAEGADVVATGTDSHAARRIAARGDVDVLLVDLRLGDEDGLAVAESIAGRCSLQVIVMSSSGRDDVAELLAAHPALPFLEKRELGVATIERALARG